MKSAILVILPRVANSTKPTKFGPSNFCSALQELIAKVLAIKLDLVYLILLGGESTPCFH